MISMNNVYLDLLFLINFFTDYLTLLCTAKLCHAEIRRYRIVLASTIGGIYACISLYYGNTWLNLPGSKLLCALLLCLISFRKEKSLLRCCIAFIFTSAVFGGVLYPFVLKTAYGNRLPFNPKALVIAFSSIYFLLTFIFQNRLNRAPDIYSHAQIIFRKKTVTITVLNDTGNELYDPISNLPVLIIEKDLMDKLMPELNDCSPNEDVYDLFCRLNTSRNLSGRIRLIPCQTISGREVLIGIIPDSLYINDKEQKMIVAYTDKKLSSTNQYQGLCQEVT